MLEKVANSLSLSLDGAGWCFLNENVTVLTMFKCEENEVNCLFERHDKASHFRFGEGDRVAVTDLVNPQRNNRTT